MQKKMEARQEGSEEVLQIRLFEYMIPQIEGYCPKGPLIIIHFLRCTREYCQGCESTSPQLGQENDCQTQDCAHTE